MKIHRNHENVVFIFILLHNIEIYSHEHRHDAFVHFFIAIIFSRLQLQQIKEYSHNFRKNYLSTSELSLISSECSATHTYFHKVLEIRAPTYHMVHVDCMYECVCVLWVDTIFIRKNLFLRFTKRIVSVYVIRFITLLYT